MAATELDQESTEKERASVKVGIAPTIGVWDVDPTHSEAEFAVKHLMISTVTGRIAIARGTLYIDEAEPELSRVEVELDVGSIDTGVKDRDAHLRSGDFFDAENNPRIIFRSTRIERRGEGTGRIFGFLTIRGVTREVALDAEFEGEAKDPWGNRRAAFSATTQILRSDFGLTWNQILETGGVLVGDKVRISLRIEAVQRKS